MIFTLKSPYNTSKRKWNKAHRYSIQAQSQNANLNQYDLAYLLGVSKAIPVFKQLHPVKTFFYPAQNLFFSVFEPFIGYGPAENKLIKNRQGTQLCRSLLTAAPWEIKNTFDNIRLKKRWIEINSCPPIHGKCPSGRKKMDRLHFFDPAGGRPLRLYPLPASARLAREEFRADLLGRRHFQGVSALPLHIQLLFMAVAHYQFCLSRCIVKNTPLVELIFSNINRKIKVHRLFTQVDIFPECISHRVH